MAVDAKRVKSLFLAAADLPDDERAAYLDRECGTDAELRGRVEALLRADAPAPAGVTGAFVTNAPTADADPTAAHHSQEEQVGTVLAGKYRLGERIGQGGMGSVWLGHQSEPVKRKVAVKLIKAGMDSKSVLARFEAERQALAVMDHPNIAKVFDGGLHDGHPFFVMELVKGVPITEYCDQRKLTPKERLELFVPVCQAIQHAHQKGIIHRDIKPSNVLVALYDDRPVPKVIDFGIAKATGGTLTEQTIETAFGGVVGTPQYMSPEQASLNNLDIDTRSDVYSLGVLLYELLTGSPPFARKELEKKGLLEILRVVREEEPPRPSNKLSTADALPSLSASRGTEPKKLTGLLRNELDWIVMKALEKDRSRRYETANGFAADVNRFLSGEAVQAHPPSTAYRVKKFVRRHRGQVIAASLVLVALLAGIAGTTVGFFEAKKQERAAVAAREEAETKQAEAEAARQAEADQRKKAETAVKAEADQRKKAEAKEAEANAVVTFFQEKVFAAARPKGQGGGLGAGVTLRDAIVAGVPTLEKGFAEQPLVEARLRAALGLTFTHLGERDQARDQFERARTLYTRHLGPDHPDTLRSMYLLATSFTALKRYADARKLHAETLAIRQRVLPQDHLDTVRSMTALAHTYEGLNRHDDALKLREETLAILRRVLPHDDPETLGGMHNLAMSYHELDRQADALKLQEETLAIQRRVLPQDHPDTLASMNNLATTYAALNRYNDALKLIEESLAVRKRVLPPDHWDTLNSLQNLALTYTALNRHDDALKVRQELLAIAKRLLPPDHPNHLRVMLELFESLMQLDREAEAILLLDEAVANARTSPARNLRFFPTAFGIRGNHFQKAADPSGCRATAEMWEALNRTDAGSLYDAACYRAVTAGVQAKTPGEAAAKLAQADADRAMAWLQKAVQAGYEDAAHMKKDADLDPLRDRADFQKLLASLTPKEPAPPPRPTR